MAAKKESRSRRNGKVRLTKTPNGECHCVSRALIATIPKVASDTGSFRRITIADFVGSLDILTMYEAYKIRKVEYKYFLVSGPNNNATFPTLLVAPQAYVTAGTPVNLDEVLQYQKVRQYQFGPSNLTYTLAVTPKISLDVANSVGMGCITQNQWIGTNNNSVLHMTTVDWLRRYNSTTDSTHTIDLQIRVWVDLRGPR